MIWWLVAIIAFLILLIVVPISIDIRFDGDFKLGIRVLFIRYVLPLGKNSQKKPKKAKKQKKTKKSDTPVKTGGESFVTKLKELADTVGMIKKLVLRASTVKKFKAHITVASDDPCSTALLFGTANALVYGISDLLHMSCTVDKTDISISADYNGENTLVLFDVILNISILKLLTCLILMLADGTIKLKETKGE